MPDTLHGRAALPRRLPGAAAGRIAGGDGRPSSAAAPGGGRRTFTGWQAALQQTRPQTGGGGPRQ